MKQTLYQFIRKSVILQHHGPSIPIRIIRTEDERGRVIAVQTQVKQANGRYS
jgi:hypothetical protein